MTQGATLTFQVPNARNGHDEKAFSKVSEADMERAGKIFDRLARGKYKIRAGHFGDGDVRQLINFDQAREADKVVFYTAPVGG